MQKKKVCHICGGPSSFAYLRTFDFPAAATILRRIGSLGKRGRYYKSDQAKIV